MCWSYIETRVSGSPILRDGAHRRGAPWRPAEGRGFVKNMQKRPQITKSHRSCRIGGFLLHTHGRKML